MAEADIPALWEGLDDEEKKLCSKFPLKTLEGTLQAGVSVRIKVKSEREGKTNQPRK